MAELEYIHEINALLDDAVIFAYKKSPQFQIDKAAMLIAANTSEDDINAFIASTVTSVEAGDNKEVVIKAVCASARNFILSKLV